MTSTPTKPVYNVVIATKGLQDRTTNITAGTTVENKGKLILTEKICWKVLVETCFRRNNFTIINIIYQIFFLFLLGNCFRGNDFASKKFWNKNYFNTFKYHVFAPMGRFQLESIYLYFPPSSQLLYLWFCPVGLSLL